MPGEQPTSQNAGKRRRRRRGRGGNGGGAQGGGQPRQPKQQAPKEGRDKQELRQPQPMPPQKPKRYAVVFYDTVMQARQDKEALTVKAKDVDQLNIVIRAESDMEDPELTPIGKVFAGAAWTLIHERRVADGWYDKPQ